VSVWYRFHLNDTLKATATSDGRRFFVDLNEAPGNNRNPLEFYRWKLTEAQEAADEIVQAYYPHRCELVACDVWRKEGE
jgi:hypothetical protein